MRNELKALRMFKYRKKVVENIAFLESRLRSQWTRGFEPDAPGGFFYTEADLKREKSKLSMVDKWLNEHKLLPVDKPTKYQGILQRFEEWKKREFSPKNKK